MAVEFVECPVAVEFVECAVAVELVERQVAVELVECAVAVGLVRRGGGRSETLRQDSPARGQSSASQ